MNEQVWIELAKVFGIPIAGFVWILRAGFKQQWVWGHEKTALLKANAELTERADFWQDKYLNEMQDLKRDFALLKAARGATS